MKYSFPAIFIIIITIFSCGKEKFKPKPGGESYRAPLTEYLKLEGKKYSSFTTVKPKVDFLFLWDNSSSTKLISNESRWAMANTINLISQNFDYRIILSPLLGDETPNPFYESYIVSEDSSYIPSSLYSRWRMPGTGAEAIFDLLTKGSLENGITRAYKLTSAGFSNGIFRNGAHMIIVVLSNGDDNSWMAGSDFAIGTEQSKYINDYARLFMSLRDSRGSKTFRFLSVVAHSPCAGSKTGSTYKAMSAKLYSFQQSSAFPSNIPQGNTPDSFDFCNMQSFYNLFDGINAAIQLETLPYTYNFWPLTTKEIWNFDRSKVIVTVRDNSGRKKDSLYENDGFTFLDGYKTNLNIIECPIHKDIDCNSPKAMVLVSGHFIELQGRGRITYPDYIDVASQTAPEYYGYVKLNFKPWLSPGKPISESITVRIKNDIRNDKIPEGGFVILPGGPIKKNIKIKSKKDFTPETPEEWQTGYFLKLTSEYVYGPGDLVEVNYWPSTP